MTDYTNLTNTAQPSMKASSFMKHLINLSLVLIVTVSAQFSCAGSFSGQSDYKLLFINHQSPEFDPNQDILNPSEKELAIEKIEEKLAGATLKSLVPMVSTLTRNATGTETDLLQLILTMAGSLKNSLAHELGTISIADPNIFPLIQDAYIVPWTNKKRDLFYNAEKISMNAGELVNVLGIQPGSEKFDKTLTQNIKALQEKLHQTSSDPTYLLGMRRFLWLSVDEKNNKKELKTMLTLRVLLGLKPGHFPFSEENDRVKLDRVAIPDVESRGSSASLTFEIDLSREPEPPLLHVEFGDFEKFEQGDFVIKESGREKVAPRFEGTVNKPGLKHIGVNFSFRKLTFDLTTQRVSSLETLVSPGIRVGATNYVMGALSVASVNDEFKGEINKTIEAEIKKSGNTLLNKILGERQ